MQALKSWRHYQNVNSFVITTNHQPFRYFCNQHDPLGCKERWVDLIQDFDFSIRYRKG